MTIIKHKIECVTFYGLENFKKKVKEFYGDVNVSYDENNRGMFITKAGETKLYNWATIAADLEWFDDAEVITDKDDTEKVMTWLNVG